MINNYNFIYFFTYQIKHTNYYFTTDKRLFNYKTKRFSKKVVRGYSTGFNINGKFITIKNLRPLLIKINKLSKNY
jgi:hypothetical protein